MNITHFWPTQTEPFRPTQATWDMLFRRRVDTFRGFAEIEARRSGAVTPDIDLSTARGQDALRLLLFRAIEEMCEARESSDIAHYSEEMIDAINYLWSAALVAGKALERPNYFAGELEIYGVGKSRRDWFSLDTGSRWPFDERKLGLATEALCGEVCGLLRNRAWMNNAQDVYFAGRKQLVDAVAQVTGLIVVNTFPDFDEFCRYFIAKDDVLQFRLHSRY